ncbi:Leu/Phe/Val dehydrogenase [Marinobacterium arenosum]|uniref:Leu/Phe/Val dehydrogenase n=1 Tax=Marinobacterium arenosum TaxID=2862496 RepID=UPI001C97B513|nr:amino acid dehydrogenase [Marinobacterium arenosum]MBY4675998.1 amino acid dehydrogenase [Marinobacterium arenosum]
MLDQMENAGLQGLHFAQDRATGLRAIIAIHSTARGPAIGGCRFLHYDSEEAAITDAVRLARGMSYKAALAGLPHGGGKAVLIEPEQPYDRVALMEAFGRVVEGLGGQYITAMDSGTNVSDMDAIAHTSRWVSCTRDSGDPSPWTALGVFEGIKAALRQRFGSDELDGCHISLQGLGHVGYAVAGHLAGAGARLTVSDINPQPLARACEEFAAHSVAPEQIYSVNADLFCPCGLGAILNDHSIDRLKVAIVAGSANNQLLEERHGDLLHQRGILYAPDYVINAGGLIFVALQHAGKSQQQIRQAVLKIGDSLQALFEEARQADQPTHLIANRRAERIIAEAKRYCPAA